MSSAPNTAVSRPDPAKEYRARVEAMTRDILVGLVGEGRVKEAAGRFALAFRATALAQPGIYKARPQAVAQAVAMCALTGLMPGGPMPQCYLIPRNEKNPETGKWDIPGLQWMISWRGMKVLVERTGARMHVVPVFAGEPFRVVRGLTPDIQHEQDVDSEWSWDSLRAVYVVVRFPDGTTGFEVVGKGLLEARRDASDSYRRDQDKSPWTTWPIEMAMKSAIRYAISRGIAPIDETGAAAFERDTADDARVVIDAEARPADRAAQPVRQIAPKLHGLDALEAELGDREPVMAQADDDLLTPAERARDESRVATAQGQPEGQRGGRGRGRRGGDATTTAPPPEAPADLQRIELITSVKGGLQVLGGDLAGVAYRDAGLEPSRRPEDLTVDELARLDARIRATADAEGL